MPTYVLMAGLPGTGKSTLANELSEQLGGVVFNKDTIRAALFPGSLTDYTREQDDLCFDAILQAANYLARHKRAEFLFLDGRTFSRREQIDQVIERAEAAGLDWKIVHVTCPDTLAEARVAKDAASHPARNRTVEMYRRIKQNFEPIVRPHIEVDTSQPLQESTKLALRYLRGER